MSSAGAPSRSAAPAIALRLAVVAAAVLVGLGLQQLVTARLEEIQTLAASDVLRARAELAGLMRWVGGSALLLTAAFGLLMVASCRRALALDRFPPPGLLGWGVAAGAVLSGPRARRRARIGMGLGAALVVLSLTALGLLGYVSKVLLACRA